MAQYLIEAAEEGNKKNFMLLLRPNLDIEEQDEEGWTAFMWASMHKELNISKYLVKHGASVHAKDVHDIGALHLASLEGNEAMVAWLLECGCDPKLPGGNLKFTPLHVAAKHGHLACVLHLLPVSEHVDVRDARDFTALMWAAQHGHLDVVIALVEAGADIEAHDKDGRTPLWEATLRCHLHVIRWLVERGVNVNACAWGGISPLQMVILAQDRACVAYLEPLVSSTTIDLKACCDDMLACFAKVREEGNMWGWRGVRWVARVLHEKGWAKEEEGKCVFCEVEEVKLPCKTCRRVLYCSVACRKHHRHYHNECEVPRIVCGCCGKEQEEEEKFGLCGRCEGVNYCSAACQQKDWAAHKAVCIKE